MRVLVIGSGGREHALVWKLAQSPEIDGLICAPGNAGIEQQARCVPIQPQDTGSILSLVQSERIDLVVVGPEAPLAAGLVDALKAEKIPALGPDMAAARLESSKIFAKEFMDRHGIPTAPFRIFSRPEQAMAVLDSRELLEYPLVIKAEGLAAGKGVVVAHGQAEARDAIERMMVHREFGNAGDRILVEQYLRGTEASYIVFTDGTTVVPAVPARDHKAAYDDDAGPNTGGMGAFSTDAILGDALERRVLEEIIRPTVDGMRAEGTPFRGILYAGLMLTEKGPQVLEFNVRMGDPEGQVILPRLESDFARLCEALCGGTLSRYAVSWSKNAAVCVVLASGGYPGSYAKGKVISGLDLAQEDPRVVVFHAGTKRRGNEYVTDGGRVLGVTATERDLAAAMIAAYEAVNKVHFEAMHYRRDIGARAIRLSA